MSTEAIYKFEPHRTIYMRGFDRRGAAAAITQASATGFKVSGVFSDIADFVVLMLFDEDDLFGHLYTTRYLPNPTLTSVVLDFDLAIVGGIYPGSEKFQSVPWGMLSWITDSGTPGTTALNITSTTGGSLATQTYTVNGTPVVFDRVQLIYSGNEIFDVIIGGTYNSVVVLTPTQVATELARQINAATSLTVPLTATSTGANFTVTCTQPGNDGNTIELLELHKTATTYITPTGTSKLVGGVDPTSFHVTLDFSAMTLTSLRQCWLTLAPPLPTDSGGTNPALVTFIPLTFSYTFSNWTITDPSSNTVLKVAGPGSTVVASGDSWASYFGSGWSKVSGFYYYGFAMVSPTIGNRVLIAYTNPNTHDLYISAQFWTSSGKFSVLLDGTAQADFDMYMDSSSPVITRRKIASAVSAGKHVVTLTVKTANPLSTGTNCYFDYLQSVVASDVQSPTTTYSDVGAAFDFDTDQTYKIPPERSIWIATKAGFLGDIDLYGGVFFALKRVRYGSSLHTVTITLSGTMGGTDVIWISIGGTFPNSGTTISGATTVGGNPTGGAFGGATILGVAQQPADTLTTMAQRIVDAINCTFVGIAATPTVTAGQLTITVLTPINGFSLDVSLQSGSTVTLVVSGDIGVLVGSVYVGGQEGTWQVDSTQSSPLNQAFQNFLADFCTQLVANSMTCTVAWSQELLNPPDANTSSGAWAQRFPDGSTVLTDTAFGSWGTGFVESISVAVGVATITQTNHGYVTGNTAHFANTTQFGEWVITVTDSSHYTFVVANYISNSGGYTPAANDPVFIDLQTSQCAFSPSTVIPYFEDVYIQTAAIMNTAGLTPWLQFGEMGHWFFSLKQSLVISGFLNSSGLIKVATVTAHGFSTGQTAILAGTAITDGTHTITVVDTTHFTVDSSTWPGGTPTTQGTVSGGGMAYYDANQTAAATTALGRSLANFYTQDDDPTINSSADANFLAARVKAQTDAIVAAVLAVHSNAKFEVLWPYDVNFSKCYYTVVLPFPQGGRMNRYVNLPSGWTAKSGSNLDRFKVEGLSWGSEYSNIDNAKLTAQFPYATLTWAKADTRYLIPWDTGTCPWVAEYTFNLRVVTPFLNFWAWDHIILFSWKLPLAAAFGTVKVAAMRRR